MSTDQQKPRVKRYGKVSRREYLGWIEEEKKAWQTLKAEEARNFIAIEALIKDLDEYDLRRYLRMIYSNLIADHHKTGQEAVYYRKMWTALIEESLTDKSLAPKREEAHVLCVFSDCDHLTVLVKQNVFLTLLFHATEAIISDPSLSWNTVVLAIAKAFQQVRLDSRLKALPFDLLGQQGRADAIRAGYIAAHKKLRTGYLDVEKGPEFETRLQFERYTEILAAKITDDYWTTTKIDGEEVSLKQFGISPILDMGTDASQRWNDLPKTIGKALSKKRLKEFQSNADLSEVPDPLNSAEMAVQVHLETQFLEDIIAKIITKCKLSKQQGEILRVKVRRSLSGQSQKNREVAQELNTTVGTIESQRVRIRQKCGTFNMITGLF